MLLLRGTKWIGALTAVRVGSKVACRACLGRHHAVLLGHTSELRVEERVISSCVCVDAVQAGTGRVDESARCCVLSRKAEVTNVSKGILSFSSSQKGVEPRAMGVHLFLGLLRLLGLLLLLWLRRRE